jgi:hypothetical protein
MDAFNYLAVLISIILGLGIAQLLTGFGRWIEQRESLRSFLPAMIWAGILLLIHVQTWWSMFGFRFLRQWTFVQFGVVLLQPISLYLLAILVLPGQSTAGLDLRANYFGQRGWFFGLMLFLLAVSVVKDLVVAGSLPSGINLDFHVAFAAFSLMALATARERVHQAIAVFAAVSMITYVALLFRELR